jgi:hypothetical protein
MYVRLKNASPPQSQIGKRENKKGNTITSSLPVFIFGYMSIKLELKKFIALREKKVFFCSKRPQI